MCSPPMKDDSSSRCIGSADMSARAANSSCGRTKDRSHRRWSKSTAGFTDLHRLCTWIHLTPVLVSLRWPLRQKWSSPPDIQPGLSEDRRFRHDSCRRLTLSFPPTLAVALLVGLLATSTGSLAARAGRGDKKEVLKLRCPPCRQIHCSIRDPKQLGCKGGVTTGVCGCCPACARLAGETCGGDLSYLGKCDQGLTCVAAPRASPLPPYRMQREPPGVCSVSDVIKTTEQAQVAATQQCRPLCSQHFCSRKPRAVCSASKGVAETARPCQGACQHTSCRACALIDDIECVRCASHDFRCLKQFGRCVARQRCRGKAGRKFCRRSRIRGNIGRRFVCKVPKCPS